MVLELYRVAEDRRDALGGSPDEDQRTVRSDLAVTGDGTLAYLDRKGEDLVNVLRHRGDGWVTTSLTSLTVTASAPRASSGAA